MSIHRRLLVSASAAVLLAAASTSVLAHEEREVGEYMVVVGFIDEPVYAGQKSGLEFFVSQGDEPVEGLEETVSAEVTYQGETRDLPVSPRFGEAGAYESVFFPTAAGAYTFRLFGTIGDMTVDESFTSSPEGFGEVNEAAAGQFPITLPAPAETAANAQAGADAAGQATFALILGAAGLLAGLAALGLALSRRMT